MRSPGRTSDSAFVERADPVPQLFVGDGVEAGEKLRRCAAVLVADQFDGALRERGAFGIALHDGAHDFRQPQPGLFDRLGDGCIGLGVRELLVGGVQVG